MFIKSLYFDLSILRLKRIALLHKLIYIIRKYIAIVAVKLSGSGHIKFSASNMTFYNVSSIGTSQSSICDFYDDIVSSKIIDRKKPVIVDVGANIGQFCNAAKLFFPDARLFSFEPDPDVFKQLRENTNSFANVKCYQLGLGDKSQIMTFYKHDLSVMSSFQKYTGHDYDANHRMKLHVKKLDDITDLPKNIDLLKIDVEGFELNVLKGAHATLARAKYLLLELSLDRTPAADTNLKLLDYISSIIPTAHIVKFGRPLGDPAMPTCQDVLIRLK